MLHLSQTGRRTAAAALVAAAATLAACSSDRLLSAEDPDIVTPGNVANADGAEALRIGALQRFRTAVTNNDANGEGYFLQSGLLADEWKSTNSFTQTQDIDGRAIRKLGAVTDNPLIEQTYRNLARARTAAIQAADALRQYRATQTSQIAQMYLVKGLAELYLAEGYCNGVTFGSAATGDVVLGPQLTTVEAHAVARASFDSALTIVGSANDALAGVVRSAARIGRGRALLGMGLDQAAAASQSVDSVATTFTGFQLSYAQVTGDNGIWSMNNDQRRYAVGDPTDVGLQGNPATIATIGTHQNSLPFATARDPRVPVATTTTAAFVNLYPTITQQLWPTRESSIAVLTGVDARLVQAEAALQRGNSAAYLTTLNSLRATVPGLTPLADPGTPEARVDQFFREKAFWQFSRGFRLGDLRRLVRQYGRPATAVYPTGRFFQSGANYGTDVVFPLPQAEGNAREDFKGCLDLNA